MSWRDRLQVRRAGIFQDCPSGELTEPTKPPFDSFGSTQEARFPNIRQAIPSQQTARLLGMLRAECLPESLLARDDAGTDGLAAMDAGELRAYALALHRSERMDAGAVPAEYTQAARCEGCGPVWLWEGCPPRVKACPWCFRRKAGRAFKRPPVGCGQCLHFLPDAINPPGGGGDCGLGLAYRRGEPLRFPFAKRQCGEHKPASDAEESAKGGLA